MSFAIVVVPPGGLPLLVRDHHQKVIATPTYNEAEAIMFLTGLCQRVPSAVIPLPETVGAGRVALARALLLELTGAERRRLFGEFCRYCGTKDPRCQCWNDE